MGVELSKEIAMQAVKAVMNKETTVEKALKDIGAHTKLMAKSMDVKINLDYQKDFPTHATHMLKDEIQTASEWDKDGSHYFAIYHPGSESFPAIRNNMRGKEEFIGCYDDLNELGLKLLVTRQSVGPEAVLYVIMPSAHEYHIEKTIHVPPYVLPLRVRGQTKRDGSPYVHAKLDVEGDFDNKGVCINLRKREKLLATSAGAGAGVAAGAAVAFVGGALLFTPAAPIGLLIGVLGAPVAATFAGKGAKHKTKSKIVKNKMIGDDWWTVAD